MGKKGEKGEEGLRDGINKGEGERKDREEIKGEEKQGGKGTVRRRRRNERERNQTSSQKKIHTHHGQTSSQKRQISNSSSTSKIAWISCPPNDQVGGEEPGASRSAVTQ